MGDVRQVVAGVLTVTMFVMLANMIKRDHFDVDHDPHHLLQVELSLLPTNVHYESSTTTSSSSSSIDSDSDSDSASASEQSIQSSSGGSVISVHFSDWPHPHKLPLKPCWDIPIPIPIPPPNYLEEEASQGFVTFSLTDGPEHHLLQIADALVVARYLRATLVVPDVRGSKTAGHHNISKFEDVYDVQKFLKSLNGVVRVVKQEAADLSERDLAVLRIRNRVSQDQIAEEIEPIFRKKGTIRLETYLPWVSNSDMKKKKKKKKSNNNINDDSVACLGMFGTLEPQPQVQEAVDSMVERLKSDGRQQFIAVDLRRVDDMLNKIRGCKLGNGGGWSKKCYSPREIATFLRKAGFDKDTPIYLTHESRWDSSLDALKDFFPKTYTKESIMPIDIKGKFLGSGELEKVIDFYICSRSDIFVPPAANNISAGMFYASVSVAGKRIASGGKTLILVPSSSSSSSPHLSHFISPYITNHFPYSCFC